MKKILVIKNSNEEFKKELTNYQINLLLPLFDKDKKVKDNEAFKLFNQLFNFDLKDVLSVNVIYTI